MYSFLIILSLVLCVQFDLAKGQGNFCYTPSNQGGTCVFLQQCPYLVQIYGYAPRDQQVINYLVGSQRNCGNRSVNRNPIVCCFEPVYSTDQPATTTTTTTTTTTSAPVTQAPSDHARQAEMECFGPDGRDGVCRNIRECPTVLSEFLARGTDPEYVQYIRNSNGICNYIQPFICCPFDSNAPVTQGPTAPATPEPSPQTPGDVRLLTPAEGCGFSNLTHKRIVGGEPAKPGAWPWIALIGYTNNLGELKWQCGGSLITSKHVLTAAHCLKSSLTTVRLGEHDLGSDTEAPLQQINVVKVAKYPSYDPKDGHNDLAILYLETEAHFTANVRPVCLPLEDPLRTKNFVGYTPFVAGWGRTSEGGQSSPVLQELQIPVLSNDVCKDRYKKVGKLISEKQFDNAVLCAGVLTGGKDSCQGDSGGPLMAPTSADGGSYYYQIGIVSYGIGCARADVPGVYSRVQTFVDWIQEKVAET